MTNQFKGIIKLLSAVGWRLSIQPTDHHRLFWLIPVFFSLGMGEVLGISSATSIFNVRYGVEYLPLIYLLEGIGLLVFSLVVTDLSGRLERPRFLRVTYGFMAGLVLTNGLILLYSKFSSLALGAIFYPVLLVSSMVIFYQLAPLIWLIAIDICPTQQAKRLFPLLSASSTIGCIVAGLAAKLLAPAGVEIVYALWGLVLLGGGYFLFNTIKYYIVPLSTQTAEEAPDLLDSIKSVYGSRFLMSILGLLILIMTLMFLMDYQFNTAARFSFNNEAQLAGFLAVFLAVSNIAAVVIELGFLSRIMTRLGVGNVILLVTSVLGFCFVPLVFVGTGPLALGTLFMSYLITKIMVNVLGEPSYQLLFKVVPVEERDGVRFLVEALFILGGMLGGAALSGLHAEGFLSWPALSILAASLAALTVYIAWKTRAMYLNELIGCITKGWQDLQDESRSLLGRMIPPSLLNRLITLLHHPDDRKRSLAFGITESMDPQALAPWLGDLLQDSSAEVRCIALRCCAGLGAGNCHEDAVLAACDDDSPEVRAAAISLLPSLNHGTDRLYRALFDRDPLVVSRAVTVLCQTGVRADDNKIRKAVERCLAGPAEAASAICGAIGYAALYDYAPRLVSLLKAEPEVRAAACRALGQLQFLDAIPMIIAVYAEADVEFRTIADQALIEMGPGAVPFLLKELANWQDLNSWLAIIKALAARLEGGMHRQVLVESCLAQLSSLNEYRDLALVLRLSELSALAELAELRYREICTLQMEACWAVLASLYDPFVIDRVKGASQETDVELRETSLEVLSEGLADRRLTRAMLDVLTYQQNTASKWDADTTRRLLHGAQGWNDYWLREIAAAALLRLEGGEPVEEQEMLSLLDKVMFLRGIEFCSYLQMEELGRLARVARLEIYPENKELLIEGVPNSRLYIITRGSVELSARTPSGVNATIAVLGAGEAFGDTTVFDEAVSPVTAEVILGEAALLTIDHQDIERLCNLYPTLATGFIKAISARVRKLEHLLITMG